MAEMNTATAIRTDDVFVDVEALNGMPLADVFPAVGPAKVIAEGVTVGPVLTDQGEKYLVRFEGKVGQLARTEEEVLGLAGPSILRHVARIESGRARAAAFAEWQAERTAKIAACSGHVMHERAEGRGHVLYCCRCGYSDGINSAD